MKYGQILRATVSKVFVMIISHITVYFIHYDRYIGGHFVVSAILVGLGSCIKYQKSCFQFYVQTAIEVFRVFNWNIFLRNIFWDFSAFFLIIFLFLREFLLYCFYFFGAFQSYWLSITLVPRIVKFILNYKTLIYNIMIGECRNLQCFYTIFGNISFSLAAILFFHHLV